MSKATKTQNTKAVQLFIAAIIAKPELLQELALHVVRVRPSVIIDAVSTIPDEGNMLKLIMNNTLNSVGMSATANERALQAFIRKGYSFIACIKKWRELTGADLRPAKAYMDELLASGVTFGDRTYVRNGSQN